MPAATPLLTVTLAAFKEVTGADAPTEPRKKYIELWLSTRHERLLRARGAVESRDPVYTTMRWAYPAVFVAMAIEGFLSGAVPTNVVLAGVAIFIIGKFIKAWAIAPPIRARTPRVSGRRNKGRLDKITLLTMVNI